MKTQLLVFLAISLLGCSSNDKENDTNVQPQIGARLSHKYTIFSIVEANERWIKYRVCNSDYCKCEENYFEYYVTCKNGSDEILSIWNRCDRQ